MYFYSRKQAGRMLAAQIAQKHQGEPCAVLALTDGGVMVGAEIALTLHCPVALLMASQIALDMEPEPIGSLASSGEWAYNKEGWPPGSLAEMTEEYRGVIDQKKLTSMHDMNVQLHGAQTISKDILHDRNVIVVSDGLVLATPLDIVYEFLKPIKIKKFIVATPLASVKAVDRMHVLADEIFCLSVVGEYINTNHYYDKQDVPDHETVLKVVEQLIQQWK